MNANATNRNARTIRQILPVILRVTCFLVLWTLGASTMTVVEARSKSAERRQVKQLPVNHARIENLQRWVNAGHDTWCRDPKSVALATVRGISSEFANYDFELASLSTSDTRPSATKAVYTFHSLDGHSFYRITLRRFGWQIKAAGSPGSRVWVPVRAETITRDSLN